MSNSKRSSNRSGVATATSVARELVPVLFTSNGEEAARYRLYLQEIGIPVVIGACIQKDHRGFGGTPLLVPEEYYDRASELIASSDAIAADDWDDDPVEDDDEDDDDEDDDDEDEDDEDDDITPDDDADKDEEPFTDDED